MEGLIFIFTREKRVVYMLFSSEIISPKALKWHAGLDQDNPVMLLLRPARYRNEAFTSAGKSKTVYYSLR